ncbi:hypothetical protein VPH35_057153 [Triticum aestivum]|uniref:uncharacterized protein n=1 Tax=Triticum aestivum TaxID=4565 RepID=UPI0008429D0B|nr:uncharacterized protein LOC123076740 [Triticum aestivum]
MDGSTSRPYLHRYLTNRSCRGRDARLQPQHTHRYSGAASPHPPTSTTAEKEDPEEAAAGSDRLRMPSPGPAALLVAAVFLWWSAAGALADGGNGTVCLCTGPQCVPPCPVPGTTSPTQFPFCPQRPAAVGPFPWEQQPPAAPRSGSGFPQDAGFLAAAASCPGSTATRLAVAAACSALLLLLH